MICHSRPCGCPHFNKDVNTTCDLIIVTAGDPLEHPFRFRGPPPFRDMHSICLFHYRTSIIHVKYEHLLHFVFALYCMLPCRSNDCGFTVQSGVCQIHTLFPFQLKFKLRSIILSFNISQGYSSKEQSSFIMLVHRHGQRHLFSGFPSVRLSIRPAVLFSLTQYLRIVFRGIS